ncbi:MAG: copper oxidase, partial [Desulfurivibrio sp.]|nr:copper oxidase [Desulfurivibrio sp.]
MVRWRQFHLLRRDTQNRRHTMTFRLKAIAIAGLTGFLLLAQTQVHAATVEYDLSISHQELNITGNPAWSMTVNGGIPGPTLRFKEGDFARIRVKNTMNVDTSIHWHGLLVPPGMDGVPNISFPPISPGSTFTYEFPIRQSGTYWYHSHTSLQEQRGVYGSIVIEPSQPGKKPDQDHVVLLSDWTDQDPHEVNRTLKRGSEWFALEKGSAQSIFGAARLGMLGDYFKRELQRMPAMDIADVAYDRFLANGKPESTLSVKPHETVRLRIIDGSATTYFHLEFAGGPMTIVAADGQDVEPVQKSRFLIAVAETYDVLIQVPASGAYEFRATAHDGSGYASVWIGSGKRHPAGDVPRPNLYHSMGNIGLKQIFALTPAETMGMPDHKVETGTFDQPGMMGMDSMDMGSMDMSSEPGMESMGHGTKPSQSEMGTMDHTPPPAKGMEMDGNKGATGSSDHSGMTGMGSMEMGAAPNMGTMNHGAASSSKAEMTTMDH